MPGPDATSLLDDIMRSALEVEYGQAATRRPDPRRGRLRMVPMLALLAILGVLSVASITAQRGNAAGLRAQRPALVDRIEEQTARVDALQRDVAALRAEVAAASRSELRLTTSGQRLSAQVDALEQAVAAVPVSGPGVRVVVDDAAAATGSDGDQIRNRIYDTDLQRLVNGLWLAGAEAVAINGQRIGPLTAIRSAGDAVLVGYRPLTRPYVVEATGDPHTLEANFVDGPGGLWLRGLRENYGIRFDVITLSDLELPAATRVDLSIAGEPAADQEQESGTS